MERHVKERLIGAAVLVAAAVILIPEMLSGPRRQGGDLPAPVDGQAPLKTYTIDLSKSPATQAAAASGAADRAAPVESSPQPAAASESQAAVAQPTPQADGAPESSARGAAPADDTTSSPVGVEAPPPSSPSESASRVEPAATVAPPRVPSTGTAPPSSASSVSKSSAGSHSPNAPNGWAVQLGSFSSEATAQRMVKDLRAKGHEAFVMPVKSGSGTMYRVRIGPMADREAAAATLQGVKSLAPGAAIVAHP